MRNRTLKNLAVSAKNRLIQKSGAVVSPTKRENVTFKILTNNDDVFFDKVKEVLEKNSISPIKELMDKKKYDGLDFFGQQKYLLDTIEKFNEIKSKIESENARKIVY